MIKVEDSQQSFEHTTTSSDRGFRAYAPGIGSEPQPAGAEEGKGGRLAKKGGWGNGEEQ